MELPREPKISQKSIEPQGISSSKLVGRLLKDILDGEKVQFGAAIPAPELVPARKLGRILAVACVNHASESIGYATSPGNAGLRSQIARWAVETLGRMAAELCEEHS